MVALRGGADHAGAGRGGDLHCEGADAAVRAVDQHRLPGGEAETVQGLVGGEAGERQRGSLGEGEGVGLASGGAHRDRHLLGEGAGLDPVLAGVRHDRVADGELRDVQAHRRDDARDVPAGDHGEDGGHQRVEAAGEDLPVHGVHSRGAHVDEDLAGADLRVLELGEGEDLGAPVAAVGDGLHEGVQRASLSPHSRGTRAAAGSSHARSRLPPAAGSPPGWRSRAGRCLRQRGRGGTGGAPDVSSARRARAAPRPGRRW